MLITRADMRDLLQLAQTLPAVRLTLGDQKSALGGSWVRP